MVALEAFSELLQVLYSAPLQQEQWQRFLALASDQTRSQNGLLSFGGYQPWACRTGAGRKVE
jgi:hypothetical protein